MGNTLKLIGTGDNFLNGTPMAQTLRSTIDKWDLMKLKNKTKQTNKQKTSVRQRTLSIGQNSSLQIGKESSPTLHLTGG